MCIIEILDIKENLIYFNFIQNTGGLMTNYFCEYCGTKDTSIQHLTAGQCPKHQNGVLEANIHRHYE